MISDTVFVQHSGKLLPCPFCGEAEELYPGYRNLGRGPCYNVDCVGCGIEFTPREGMDVIAAWNRRVTAIPALTPPPLMLDDVGSGP